MAPAELPKEGTGFDLTNRVPGTPVGAGVSDHVWKIEGFVALPASDRQNLSMRALIIKVLIGIAIGIAIILVFVLFAHSSTPV